MTISITFGGSFQPYPGGGSGGGNGPSGNPPAPVGGPFNGLTVANLDANVANGGYLIGNNRVLDTNVSLQSVYLGESSGRSQGQYNTHVGWGSGAACVSGGENTFIGNSAGTNVTTGSFNTALGQHTLGCETTINASTAVGNDSQRNVISASGANTSVGQHSQYIHGGSSVTSFGQAAYVGNGACIMLGGTATLNDTISLTVTGSFTGSPQTVGITVSAGQSLASQATALYNAFKANSILLNLIGQGSISGVFDTSNINLNWFGVSVQSVTVTAAVTGSATETVTVLNGATANSNIAIGQRAMQALYLTTATNCIGIGANTLYKLQSGNNNIAIGGNAGQSITTGHDNLILGNTTGTNITTSNFNTFVGNTAGNAATTVGNTTLLGFSAGASLTTGGSNTLIGASVGSTVLTTGSGNIFIGVSATLTAASASESNTLRIGNHATNVIVATGINTATPVVAVNGTVSIGAYTSAIAPTTSNIAASMAAVWKNTGDGTVKLYFNDAGTLKSVALS